MSSASNTPQTTSASKNREVDKSRTPVPPKTFKVITSRSLASRPKSGFNVHGRTLPDFCRRIALRIHHNRFGPPALSRHSKSTDRDEESFRLPHAVLLHGGNSRPAAGPRKGKIHQSVSTDPSVSPNDLLGLNNWRYESLRKAQEVNDWLKRATEFATLTGLTPKKGVSRSRCFSVLPQNGCAGPLPTRPLPPKVPEPSTSPKQPNEPPLHRAGTGPSRTSVDLLRRPRDGSPFMLEVVLFNHPGHHAHVSREELRGRQQCRPNERLKSNRAMQFGLLRY